MGSSCSRNGDPLWYGYMPDGKGWTVRPKSIYMTSPDYNSDLRRQMKQQRNAQNAVGYQQRNTYDHHMGQQPNGYGAHMATQPSPYNPHMGQQPGGYNHSMGQQPPFSPQSNNPNGSAPPPPPYQADSDGSKWGYLGDGKGWTPT